MQGLPHGFSILPVNNDLHLLSSSIVASTWWAAASGYVGCCTMGNLRQESGQPCSSTGKLFPSHSPPRAHSHPAALRHGGFALATAQLVAVVLRRQVKLLKHDVAGHKGRLVQTLVMGLIVGSLFWRVAGSGDAQDARAVFGAAFLLVMFMVMSGMTQVGGCSTCRQRAAPYERHDAGGWLLNMQAACCS